MCCIAWSIYCVAMYGHKKWHICGPTNVDTWHTRVTFMAAPCSCTLECRPKSRTPVCIYLSKLDTYTCESLGCIISGFSNLQHSECNPKNPRIVYILRHILNVDGSESSTILSAAVLECFGIQISVITLASYVALISCKFPIKFIQHSIFCRRPELFF